MGRNGSGGWGQIYDYWPDEAEAREQRGRLVVAGGMVFPSESDAVKIVEAGREVLTLIQGGYYQDKQTGAFGSLKQTAEMVNVRWPEFEGVVAAAVGEVWYFVVIGKAGVWLSWEGKEGWIIPINQGGEERVRTASGWRKQGQVVVMGNGKFWEKLPVETMRKALEKGNEDWENTIDLITTVERREDSEGEVGMILRVEKEITQSVTREEEPPIIKVQEKKETGIDWWKKIREKWRENNRPVFVATPIDKSKPRKRTMVAGLVMLGLLLILMAVGRAKVQQKALASDVNNQLITSMMDKFIEARAIVGLNPTRSRELVEEIKIGLNQVSGKNIKDSRIAEIQQGLTEVERTASGINNLTGGEIVDLALIREGMSGKKMTFREGIIWIVDGEGTRLIKVDPVKKTGEVVLGKEEISGASLLASYPGKTEILAQKGVVEVKDGSKPKTVITKDSGWKDIRGIVAYAGNVYLLDSGANQIWRYTGGESGFGSKAAWIGKDEEVSFSSAVGITVDGSIWTVSENGQVTKITRGVVDSWSAGSGAGDMRSVAGIYTDEDAQRIYIWDKGGKRIVVFKKSGEYEKQYVNEGLGGALDVSINEKTGKIYWLAGSKVWEGAL